MRAKTKPGKRTEENPDPEPVRALSDATIGQVYTVLRAGLDGAARNVTASHEPVGVKPLLQHGLSQDEREDFRAHDVLLQQ